MTMAHDNRGRVGGRRKVSVGAADYSAGINSIIARRNQRNSSSRVELQTDVSRHSVSRLREILRLAAPVRGYATQICSIRRQVLERFRQNALVTFIHLGGHSDLFYFCTDFGRCCFIPRNRNGRATVVNCCQYQESHQCNRYGANN